MADKTTSESSVKLIMEMTDGTEQTLTQTNPTSDSLVDKINAFGQYAQEKNLIVSTKSETGRFSRIKQAILHNQAETEYDLTPQQS